MLLACLLGIAVAGVCAFVEFRFGAIVLALIPAGLAAVRAMPTVWGEAWTNRSKVVDIVTCLLFAALLVGIAFVVPLSR